VRINGYIQREGQVVHVIAQEVEDLSWMLSRLSDPEGPQKPETWQSGPPAPRARHPREQAKRLFPSRDFH
jgi:error-prone DNA polymerase